MNAHRGEPFTIALTEYEMEAVFKGIQETGRNLKLDPKALAVAVCFIGEQLCEFLEISYSHMQRTELKEGLN